MTSAGSRSAGRRSRVRDELAPQLRDYARMGSGVRWVPFVMFLQQAGFRSQAVNTDRFGFRWSVSPEGKVWSVEEPPEVPSGLVVGGSMAFGVGATRDSATAASALAARTDRPWLNLAGRAHVSTQELLAFMLYEDGLPELRDIVILSGLNDVTTQYAANRFDERLGGFLESEYFRGLHGRARERWWQKRFRAAFKRARDVPPVPFEEILAERESRRTTMLGVQARNLSHWRALAAARSARLWFVLQPTTAWLEKEESPEERDLRLGREPQDPRRDRIVDTAVSQITYRWYAPALEALCAERGIGFLDLNQALRPRAGPDEWLFVDRAHLTDRGYAACADCLVEHLE